MVEVNNTLRNEVIFIEMIRRILRAMAAPQGQGVPTPTLADVMSKFGTSDSRIDAWLTARGLVQAGALTEAGRKQVIEIETNRVRARWDTLVRWYVRLRTLAENNPPEKGGNVVIAVQDYALAFLSECLAFHDWLLKAAEPPLNLFEQAKIEALYKQMDLLICNDLGIESKHMYVEHPSKRNARAKVDAHPAVTDAPAIGGGLDLLVFVGGQPRDLLAVAKACYSLLCAFVREAHAARSEAIERGEIADNAPQGPCVPENVTVPELSRDWMSSRP